MAGGAQRVTADKAPGGKPEASQELSTKHPIKISPVFFSSPRVRTALVRATTLRVMGNDSGLKVSASPASQKRRAGPGPDPTPTISRDHSGEVGFCNRRKFLHGKEL